MKSVFILIFISLTTLSFSQEAYQIGLKKGKWVAKLNLSDTDVLPFNMVIEKNGKDYSFSVLNGEERISLDSTVIINDSIHLMFPFFNSELVFHVDTKKSISGYWQNFNKGDNYTIGFNAKRSKSCRFLNDDKKQENIRVE